MRRLSTSKGRQNAYRIQALRNKRAKTDCWFIGVWTGKYFWLDIDNKSRTLAEIVGQHLSKKLETTVYVFRSGHGHHLITLKELDSETWKNLYEYYMGFDSVCEAFCKCSIRYGKATLRVSPKRGLVPRLVRVIPYQRDRTTEERRDSLKRKNEPEI